MNVPAELKYTASHEWVKVDGDIATIGITDHAQSELGDVVFADLPTVGLAVANEQSFGTVESVKTVSELYAPLGGEVVEVNPKLTGQIELVNSDPYGDGWMVKIRFSDPADLEALLSAGEYGSQIQG